MFKGTENDPLIRASAFRSARGKSVKIAELGITPDMSEDAIDEIVSQLAEKKAEETGKKFEDIVKGQRWYVEDLVKFSGLDAQERLDYEYMQKFPDIASEDEMLQSLEDLITAP